MIGDLLTITLTVVIVGWCGALVIGATWTAIAEFLDWWDARR
jgi:hypothetical protein